MCGIAGLLTFDRNHPPFKAELHRMVQLLWHRGPDYQQVWGQPGITLGHTRLSILDLDSRSNQPMIDPDTGRVIVYNGEVYNYLELRQELQAKGYVFRTESDTEVILKAYDVWGSDCLNRFNGMWAFAMYDPRQQSLFCARDRFGIKPFVYGVDNEKLVFASESKAIAGVFPTFREPNWPYLAHFLQTGVFAADTETFYARLQNLLPGHYFIVKPGETPQPQRYWQWQPRANRVIRDEREILSQFQELLQDAIRLRFRSDVPVGICLSGGLDSSSLLGQATRLFNQPMETFSAVFPEHPALDESSYIRQIVDRFQPNAHFVTPRFDDFAEILRQCTWEQDGPTGGSSLLTQRAVMELAHGKVKVLLDGQGADEVLGGYHAYFATKQLTLMRELLRQPSLKAFWRLMGSLYQVSGRTGQPWPDLVKLRRKAKHMPVAFRSQAMGKSNLDAVNPVENDFLTTAMLENLLFTLPKLLHYEDRNSMAFSIESRLPYLDYRLVEFLFSLPHALKIRGDRTKYLLSRSGEGLLPDKVLHRKDKLGYATPGGQWLQEAARRGVLDSFSFLKPLPEGLTEHLPSEWQTQLQAAWRTCKQSQPLTKTEETLLWRSLTTQLWLDPSFYGSIPEAVAATKV